MIPNLEFHNKNKELNLFMYPHELQGASQIEQIKLNIPKICLYKEELLQMCSSETYLVIKLPSIANCQDILNSTNRFFGDIKYLFAYQATHNRNKVSH